MTGIVDAHHHIWRRKDVPWLEGPSNIIGWAILAFAIYQAWIMNRKANIEIAGPFFTRQVSPPAAT